MSSDETCTSTQIGGSGREVRLDVRHGASDRSRNTQSRPAGPVYRAGAGADGSVCQSLNSFPCGSLQVENQPMAGTGIGSFASPPSSFTHAPPALISSPPQ